VREPAIARGLIDADRFDAGIRDLYRTAADDGTFSYTFFKAVATNVVEADPNDLAAQLAGSGGNFGDLLGRSGG
jgi:HD superfamily phosphohydrolase